MSSDPQRRRRPSRPLVRAVVLACAVIIGAPASAIGVWMIRHELLRRELLAEGLPPGAPIDRDLAEWRRRHREYANTATGNDYFRVLISQLSDRQSGSHRTRLPDLRDDELFFYLGPPGFVAPGLNGSTAYFYETKMSGGRRIEVLVIMKAGDPHTVEAFDVRHLGSTGASAKNDQPFPRDRFEVYRGSGQVPAATQPG